MLSTLMTFRPALDALELPTETIIDVPTATPALAMLVDTRLSADELSTMHRPVYIIKPSTQAEHISVLQLWQLGSLHSHCPFSVSCAYDEHVVQTCAVEQNSQFSSAHPKELRVNGTVIARDLLTDDSTRRSTESDIISSGNVAVIVVGLVVSEVHKGREAPLSDVCAEMLRLPH